MIPCMALRWSGVKHELSVKELTLILNYSIIGHDSAVNGKQGGGGI